MCNRGGGGHTGRETRIKGDSACDVFCEVVPKIDDELIAFGSSTPSSNDILENLVPDQEDNEQSHSERETERHTTPELSDWLEDDTAAPGPAGGVSS